MVKNVTFMNSFHRASLRGANIWRGRDRFMAAGQWLNVENKRILDVGCNICSIERMFNLADKNSVYGIDINPSSGDDRIMLKRHDIEEGLPYPDGFFDVVIFLEVIEHLHNYRLVMKEIKRVLKDGGMLVISTPNRNSVEGILGRALSALSGKTWVAWDDTHKHIFSYPEFRSLLERDFSIDESLGLYFLWTKIEILSFGPLPYLLRLLRKGTDRLFSRNRFLRALGFDMVMKCTKNA
jgi:SAM-dependent methyltransferase